MGAPLEISALGAPLELVALGPHADEMRAALAERWPLCHREPGALPVGRVEVTLGGTGTSAPPVPGIIRVAGPDLARVLVETTQSVTRLAIGANIGRLLMFHAAGIAHPTTGATAVCVAKGGTGKTTLCRTLAPGRGYLSDETVGITEEGHVLAYPKPLSVRRPGSQVKDEMDPTRWGLRTPGGAPYVTAVLLLDRSDEGPDEPLVEVLDPFLALTDVSPEISSLSRLPRPLHRLHELLGSVAMLARVEYRESAALEPLLDQLIGPVP